MSSAPRSGLRYADLHVGLSFRSPGRTITDADLVGFAGLTGDYSELHTSDVYAKNSQFGRRVAHGLLGLSIADGLKSQSDYRFHPGMSLGWQWDFVGPIRIGDTVHVKFRVASLRRSKSRPGWGIVVLPSELINQRGEVVQKGEHRVMVPCRPQGLAA
jgi:acyl dehydratase